MPELVPHLVSTVIPVHNRPEMLKVAVKSVLAQTYRPIEILIVDDGSTDDTSVVAKMLAQDYPGVIRVLAQSNQGPGPARELGRINARGEFIQYLDSDDRLLPNKFTDQVRALRDHPECEVAYGITRLVDAGGRILAQPFKWTGRQYSALFPGLLVDRWWCTHTPLYTRSVCSRVGPWSDLRYSQDWEYDARVGATGAKITSTQSLVSEHCTHADARQTGSGRWLNPSDQVRFFSSLYECACRGGIAKSSPEMQHFSRWVFLQARRCGAMGDSDAAQKLYELALEIAVSHDVKLKLVGVLSKIVGWRVVGAISLVRDRLLPSKVGPDTKKMSWMTK